MNEPHIVCGLWGSACLRTVLIYFLHQKVLPRLGIHIGNRRDLSKKAEKHRRR